MKNNEEKNIEIDEPGGSEKKGQEKRKKTLLVRISNVSEDVWPFIQQMGDLVRPREVDENAGLADRDLFFMSDEMSFTFIAPKAIDDELVNYYKKLCLVRELMVLTPKKHSGVICDDVLNDEKLFDMLVSLGNDYDEIRFSAYSTTEPFLRLVDGLRERGVNITLPDSPQPAKVWTVNFFGSKSGIRQMVQKSGSIKPDVKMPDGVVLTGIFDVAKIAASKYTKEGGVVLKTNKGHSGAGVLIFRKGDLSSDFGECERQIADILSRDTYWEKFPVIVETFIKPDPRIGGGFPNAEFYIHKSGRVELLYYGGMRVTDKGVFNGMEIGEKSLPKKVSTRITDIGFFIGEKYAEEGYRGYFDIDFIAGKDGGLYISESNTRVTGGTHVYKTALELVGKEFMRESYILFNNDYPLERTDLDFVKIKKILRRLAFGRRKKEGVVIVSANLLAQGKFAYIVFGKNKRRASAIEKEMMSLLKQ